MTTYMLQSARYGTDWKDDPNWGKPDDPSNLQDWITIAHNCDHFDGRYKYRIVDQMGEVVWRQYSPFEPLSVESTDAPGVWLRAIQRNYGLPDELFAQACREWLAALPHRAKGA